MNMDPLFEVHILNEVGKGNARAIATAFDELLTKLRGIVDEAAWRSCPSSEFEAAERCLETACFYAKKAMANNQANQLKGT